MKQLLIHLTSTTTTALINAENKEPNLIQSKQTDYNTKISEI